MYKFINKLFAEYPIPDRLSIWGYENEDTSVADLRVLIESCVDELASDILITSYIEATGMITHMPEGTITCTSASLSGSFPFQGNRLVKVTYNKAENVAYLRYYPAVISYQRRFLVQDLDTVMGDRLIYIKSYCLWKMAEKELSMLKAVNMSVDNGTVDLSVLETFRDKMYNKYKELKEEVLLYSTVN